MEEFNMEGLNQRRQQRQEKQQKRQRQHKNTLIRLGIAAVVLLICGILIFELTRNRGKSPDIPSDATGQSLGTVDPSDPTATVPTVSTTAPAEEAQDSGNKTVIHFTAAGDLNVTDRTVASGGDGFDYTRAFQDVVPLLASADLTAINFEGNLVGPPYGSQYGSAPYQLMTALQNAGVDIVQTANSYAIKNGFSGMVSTLQSIRLVGLETLGSYTEVAEFRETGGYTIRDINGVRVAVVAFTKGMDGMALPAGSEDCVNLLYTDYSTAYQKVNTDGIARILRNIQREKPDFVIALVHWGSEYNDTHSKTQEKIKELLLEEGVNAIIGTHPHYVQEMVYDPEAGTFVAYSLGDFFSDGARSGTEYSVILDLEITKDHTTGATKISGFSYTPIFTVSDEELLRVVRLEEAMAAYDADHLGKVSAETYADMQYALTRIQARVVPKEETDSKS